MMECGTGKDLFSWMREEKRARRSRMEPPQERLQWGDLAQPQRISTWLRVWQMVGRSKSSVPLYPAALLPVPTKPMMSMELRTDEMSATRDGVLAQQGLYDAILVSLGRTVGRPGGGRNIRGVGQDGKGPRPR